MCVFFILKSVFVRLSPAGFVISPVRNLLLGLIPGESSSPHRGAETGCFLITNFRHIERLHYMMIN